MNATRGEQSPTAESQWQRLVDQIDFANRFWLGIIFSSSPARAAELRHRLEELFVLRNQAMLVWRLKVPEEIRNVQNRLQTGSAAADAGCVLIECLEWDAIGAPRKPWEEAWREAFMRLNHQRNALRREMKGGLIFVIPPEAKVLLRETAPDFWDVRDLVIEIERLPEDHESALSPDFGEPTTLAVISKPALDDPAYSLLEFERTQAKLAEQGRVAGPEIANQMLDAAEASFRLGGIEHAAQLARDAAKVLEGTEYVFAQSRALSILAEISRIGLQLESAKNFLQEAINLRLATGQIETIPLSWFLVAGRLALENEHPEEALSFCASALRSNEIQKQQNPASLIWARNEAQIRMLMSEAHLASHNLDAAKIEAIKATNLDRRAMQIAPDDSNARDALFLRLVQSAARQRAAGDDVAAKASYREAVELGRNIARESPPSVDKLRTLSFALNRLGEILAEAEDHTEALAVFSEALDIRRQILRLQPDDEVALRDVSSASRKVTSARHALGQESSVETEKKIESQNVAATRYQLGNLPHTSPARSKSIPKEEAHPQDETQSKTALLQSRVASYQNAAEQAAQLVDAADWAGKAVLTARDLARLTSTNDILAHALLTRASIWRRFGKDNLALKDEAEAKSLSNE